MDIVGWLVFEGIQGHVLDDIRRQILDGEGGFVLDVVRGQDPLLPLP